MQFLINYSFVIGFTLMCFLYLTNTTLTNTAKLLNSPQISMRSFRIIGVVFFIIAFVFLTLMFLDISLNELLMQQITFLSIAISFVSLGLTYIKEGSYRERIILNELNRLKDEFSFNIITLEEYKAKEIKLVEEYKNLKNKGVRNKK